jgi:large subunit ribosomal protein L7/L12
LEAAARQLLPAARGALWQRHYSSDAEPEQREITDPTVIALADQITQLNLLQVSDLTELIKKRLGITSSPMMGMPMGMPMMGGGGGAAPAAAQPAEAAPPVEEKTEFTLKLDGFDASAKIKVIKEVRAITGLGLKEAKDLVSTQQNRSGCSWPDEAAFAVSRMAMLPVGHRCIMASGSQCRPNPCCWQQLGFACMLRLARMDHFAPLAEEPLLVHGCRWRGRPRCSRRA